ncbi:MAG: alanine dehydrogenase [Phenylobacterium sp.]|uniref:alanine dehydrogenase n=1 Tax=Phenylobacterium sp. TaxID=1871053 RepID=UPI001A4BA298|nr:alanine dehydrogenase [Phenylobacterium sp.]MBL8774032.1 alanine dehydrogenase [Phenylobacterium sp.]
MRIGTPKEVKVAEARVGLTPEVAHLLVSRGHQVFVEAGAGAGIGLSDQAYAAAGATIVPDADALFETSDLIVKVKEPQPAEIARLAPRHVLFTYLHLAPDPAQARGLMESGAVCIAYETVTAAGGGLPLLAPMSKVAGRMAAQVGAACLLSPAGGRGLLLGGVPGTPPGEVITLGGGVSGLHAAEVALGLGARVTVFDISIPRLDALHAHFGGRVSTRVATPAAIADAVAGADLVIGCVLAPGAAAPRLVSRADVGRMRKGSVLVDVAIDQGGCFETSRPTTHVEPTFEVDGVLHYCVANMPGAAPLTSTQALTAATAPFVAALADKGWRQATCDDPHLAAGLNVVDGRIVHPAVREALGFH